MRVVAILANAILLTAALSAQAAKVTGKVVVTGEFREALGNAERKQAENNRAYYWNEPNGIASVRPPYVNPASDLGVVLFREGAPAPAPDELSTIKVHAGAMERMVVVTRPGSTIRFRNVDPYDHQLYVPGMASFQPELQSNGSFRPIEFPEEGIFEIRCKLMPHFKAHVVVTKATIVAPVKRDGTFLINDAEPGKYTLKIFHDGKWIYKQSFEVTGAGGPKLEIKLKPDAPVEQNAKKKKEDEKAADGKK